MLGQAAHVVVAFDYDGFAAEAAFHHVRIDRALHEEIHRADFFCLFFKHADELFPNDPAFLLGLLHAGQFFVKAAARVDADEIQIIRAVLAEYRANLFAFVLAQQAVIDKHTGELTAHRLCEQHRRNRGIHTARQRAQNAPRADFFAQRGNRLFYKGFHPPVTRAAADLINKIGKHFRALLRVQHLRVELHCIQALFRPFHRSARAMGAVCANGKARRRRLDIIGVAHPADSIGRNALEQL